MKIIILGAGQVGSTLAENLSSEHHVTVVDTHSEPLLALQNRLDIRTVVGVAAYPQVLKEAGADDADMILAVTSSDETNIVACQIAYCLFKTPTKIARVRCREISERKELFQVGKIAIDTIINPADLVTQRLKRQIEHPGTLMVLDFAGGAVQIASVRATPPCSLIGRKVLELHQDVAEINTRIVGILRDEKAFIPDEDTLIQAHDELLFCAAKSDINKVMQIWFKTALRYRRIMIAGGGNIGIGLAKLLEEDHNVKLLDCNAKQCEMAAERLHNTVVLMGDSSDAELLVSENIDETDLFCSVTNDDEANIMSAIVAKRLGAKHTIALVNRQTYAHYLIERSPDIDMALSPQRITGGQILTHLRKGDVVHVYALSRGQGEAIEVVVHEGDKRSKVVGKSLRQLKLPPACRICAVYRDDKVLMADADFVLQVGDHVVIFLCDQADFKAVEKLFQVSPMFIK